MWYSLSKPTDNIDTSTAMGRFSFHVMSTLAEMEQELIVERTNAGLIAARAQGRIGGRPVSLLQDSVDLEVATEAEEAALLEWKKYRVLLSRVDTSLAPDIEWTEIPK